MSTERINRSSLLTIAAIAICAYAACDMIHEVLGHGTASLFVPGARALSLSTVALQTERESRIVAAAGAVANVITGIVVLLIFRRGARSPTTQCFLLLLAALNLFNGTGYLMYSALLNSGDWAVVIAGLQPAVLWRAAMGIAGIASYAAAVYVTGRELTRLVVSGRIARSDVRRLVYGSYIAGGLLLVAGAALNPIDLRLILMSGVSSGFGAMAGLLFLPGFVEARTASSDDAAGSLPLSYPWIIAAIVVAVIFIFLIGPGIAL
ncbi:MAG: hypothetical protein ACXV5L_00505 [Thermoanaerobaculia bacterium]